MAGGDESRASFSAADWELVKDLVYTCQTEPPPDLDAWLRVHCPSEKIRREVTRLLRASSNSGGFMAQSATEQHLGVRLHQPMRIGRYQVMEEIGSGGSGVVYAAWDESLNRKVALKVLQPDAAQNTESQKRLRWDARAASALQHPNIIVVHEVGSEAGVDYVSMECITGHTLSFRLKAGRMEAREVLRCAIQICSGLEAAHAAGIVHRDLKPGNIMITEQGVVKILDFGLAKSCDGGVDSKDAPETVEGRFAGTVAYVSPEQAESKPVDARSDIFSFGSVLFEMLTGRQAFPGTSTISILADILHTDPRPPQEVVSGVDPRFQELVGRCLRKDRDRRFQSIAEVRVRLLELEEQILHPENQPPVATPPRRWSIPALAAVAIAIAGLSALGTWFLLRPTPHTFTLTRITADRGFTGFPAVSNDGGLLAYASDRAGRGDLDIWVQHINGNEPRQLTTDPADDSEPVFSPDGTQLAFRSERGSGGIYTISALGGTERLLVAGGHGPQFSPDGKWIAYWTGRYGGSLQPGSVQIYIIPALGGTPEQFQPGFPACVFPLWSPDGQRILFLGNGPGGSAGTKVDWWTAPVRGGAAAHATGLAKYFTSRRLNPLPMQDWVLVSAWLPDQTLLFSASHVDARNIWSLKIAADGTPREGSERLTAGTSIEWHPAVAASRADSFLAYEAMAVDSDIWRVPLDGNGRPTGAAQPFVTGFASMGSSSISADGSRLVFVSKQQSRVGRLAIRMVELNSNSRSIVTSLNSRYTARPIISGDGKTVVYTADKSAIIMPTAGGAAQPICTHCGVPTHISFDGRAVLLEAVSVPEQIQLVADGKPPKPLIELDPPKFTMQSAGRFSANGRWIVFAAGNANSSARQILIAPFHPDQLVRAGELRPVTEGEFLDSEPYWAPNGKTIFFASRRDGFQCIYGRSVDESGQPQGAIYPVSHFHQAGRLINGPDAYSGNIGLSAGPNSLVFVVSQSNSDLWLKTETKDVDK